MPRLIGSLVLGTLGLVACDAREGRAPERADEAAPAQDPVFTSGTRGDRVAPTIATGPEGPARTAAPAAAPTDGAPRPAATAPPPAGDADPALAALGEEPGGGALPGQSALDNLGVTDTASAPATDRSPQGGGTTIIILPAPAGESRPAPSAAPAYAGPFFVDPLPVAPAPAAAAPVPDGPLDPATERSLPGTSTEPGVPPTPGTPRNLPPPSAPGTPARVPGPDPATPAGSASGGP
jgi:hypothetical protein